MGILGYKPRDGSSGRRTPVQERYRAPDEPRERGRDNRLRLDRALRAREDLKSVFDETG